MQTEYELKVPGIAIEHVEKKLINLWATLKSPERLMKRRIYEMSSKTEWMRIRLRYDWYQATLTIKEVSAHTIDGTQELEVRVGDFDTMHQMLIKMWYVPLTYQENKRISRRLDDCDIEIDTRPMLEPYLEVEWKDSESVFEIIHRLWYSIDQTIWVKVKQMYESKWIDLHDIKRLTFWEYSY